MIALTNGRVENNTDPASNERIRDEIRQTVAHYETANLQEITYRLAELDQEWDVERVLELNFSGVVLMGLTMGTLSSRKWRVLPVIAACFMVQHVLQGWCPPLAILRRLGVRTANEINRERMALKTIRGDFADFGVAGTEGNTAYSLLQALER